MQRTFWIVFGLAATILALAVVWKATPAPAPVMPAKAEPTVDAGADAGQKDGASTESLADAPVPLSDAGLAGDGSPSIADLIGPPPAPIVGAKMPDGSPVPPLPADAPRAVKVGIVLVGHSEAQPSAVGVPNAKRTRAEAKELAEKIAADADKSFKEAVGKGDQGSSEDIGRIRRGELEPYLEYLVFTIPVGKFSAPLDAPRGYWIVKRIE